MDPKMWMREQLHSGAFATADDVKPVELAEAARVALRLPREQWRQSQQWAEEVLAEPPPKPSSPPPPPAKRCAQCGQLIAHGEPHYWAYMFAAEGRWRIGEGDLSDPSSGRSYPPRPTVSRQQVVHTAGGPLSGARQVGARHVVRGAPGTISIP